MSVHSSLARKGLGVVHRNVFNRYERLERLKVNGQLPEGQKVIALPKVRSIKLKK